MSTSLGLGRLSVENDLDGIESTIAYPVILPPLRSLRAGPDSQRERIGEALI